MQFFARISLLVLLVSIAGCGCSEDKNTLTTSCSVHETRCGEACVDTTNDALHCGGCNNTCGTSLVCVDARCASSCEGEEVPCDGRCVDLDNDPANCGACGNTCGGDQVCSKGKCAADCDEGLVACEGACVDLSSDAMHCGDCGEYCGKSQVCIEGVCENPCPAGMRECAGGCTDLTQDADNCGACGNVCGSNEICVNESCVGGGSCPGETDCGGACVDTDWSDLHCGACNNSCLDKPNTEGGRCEDATCELDCREHYDDCDGAIDNGCETDLRSEVAHCGACHNDCRAGANVASAQCSANGCLLSCESGWADCGPLKGISCETNLNQDPDNCGACGVDCRDLPNAATTRCAGGVCEVLSCQDGFGDCNAEPGCETDTNTSNDHCGGCNNPCANGCVDGKCAGVISLAAYSRSTCAIVAGGKVFCWGDNPYGQAGAAGGGKITKPNLVAGIEDAVQMSMGEAHVCAVRSDGKVLCWGKNNQGQLGRGSADENANPTAELVQNLDGATAVSASMLIHSCAIRGQGEVWCWGYNANGELGDGTKSTSYTPVRALGISKAIGITTGNSHSCALLQGGQVWCWGQNGGKTKLGRWENVGSPPLPDLVPNLANVDEISAGDQHTCARYGGQVKCWGDNSEEQLGADAWKATPWPPSMLPVTNLNGARQIDAGYAHTCALLNSGKVVCWGINFAGQLGIDKATAKSRTPLTIAGVEDAVQVVSGGGHSCALIQGGEVLCWGNNDSGQLGDGKVGSATSRHTVAPVIW